MRNARRQAKPFIKWAGGKTQLISSIEQAIPSELYKIPDLSYVEPFVGGGAMLFWALSNLKDIQKAVINDINEDLTTAYKTVRDNVDVLVSELKQIEKEYKTLQSEESRKEYYIIKRALFNTKELGSIENTALFIFLNRTCFNGLYRVNSRGLFNVPFGKYANPTICDEDTLFSDSELLHKVEILTGDFAQTLDYAKKNAFFYIDPPYKPISTTSSFTSYAKDSFNDNAQIRLKEFCDKLDMNKCFFVLSNSDVKSHDPANEFFDELYSQYKIDRVWASRSINANADKRGKLKELLISNYYNEEALSIAKLTR